MKDIKRKDLQEEVDRLKLDNEILHRDIKEWSKECTKAKRIIKRLWSLRFRNIVSLPGPISIPASATLYMDGKKIGTTEECKHENTEVWEIFYNGRSEYVNRCMDCNWRMGCDCLV